MEVGVELPVGKKILNILQSVQTGSVVGNIQPSI
jgi:hypothetical protein